MNAQRVETQYFKYGSIDSPVKLHRGGELPGVTIAYQTWGELNEAKDNAILICHALSGSHHVTGFNPDIPEAGVLWQAEMHQGWWENFVGSGKVIDTDKYFVISANYLGGCYGSTGPMSIDPRTQKPYGSSFPHLAVCDQSDLFYELIKSFDITQLHASLGPSVGGLVTLTLATRHPEIVRNVILIASGFKTTVLNRLILFEQILAIENDIHFNGGDYYEGKHPNDGLALARMISHKTFVHLDAIEKRARQEIKHDKESLKWYELKDPFQSYMLYQGKKFVKRFDANTYLRIIDMWSSYDAIEQSGHSSSASMFAAAKKHNQRYLVFSIDSDFCFYPEEQEIIVNHLKDAEVENIHITVHSEKGHDSFLIEPEFYAPHISYLLKTDSKD